MTSINSLLGLPLPLVLASQSPRRQSLLTHLGFDFSVVRPDVDEDTVALDQPPSAYVQQLARMKAERGLLLVDQPSMVIGSDTTVVLDGNILNKPSSAEHAVDMLQRLSGRTHTVHTGVAIAVPESYGLSTMVVSRQTDVTFRRLEIDEIEAYVASGSPMDKAGAYGIQDDLGAVFVSHISGCYYTIVGLPLELLYTSLKSVAQRMVPV